MRHKEWKMGTMVERIQPAGPPNLLNDMATSPLPSRGPKRGRKCYVTPDSWGSPTKGTKSEVKTNARGNNDTPSISKYGSLVRPNAQIVAQRALSAPPKRSPVGHGSKKMTGACPAH